MYYLKGKTDFQGKQQVDIFYHIYYDNNSDLTIEDRKIIGQKVVDCSTVKHNGNIAESIYEQYKNLWEKSTKEEFESFVCSKFKTMSENEEI